MIREDIHDSLKRVYEVFDTFCKENGCFYDIACDESDKQGYILKNKDFTNSLYDYVLPCVNDNKVHVELDHNRKDGVMFVFTIDSIQDSHWRALSKKPKREDYSFLANPEDARKVRSGKTIYQKKFHKNLDKILESDLHIPTVAIDLDGTLAKQSKFNNDKIGDPRPGAKKALRSLQDMGCRVIIFTVRGDVQLVKDWCHEHDIPYDYINENPDQPKDASGKVIADVYVDDRALDARGAWGTLLDKIRSRLNIDEDQRKSPTRKHLRSQSMFRSSFGKSKSFGGVTEAAVCGGMIPPFIERPSNIGLVSADRTTTPGEKKKLQSYKTRKDLTDIPLALPATIPVESEDEEIEESFLGTNIDLMVERTIPGTMIGRTNDRSKRLLVTKKVVPDAQRGKDFRGDEFSGSQYQVNEKTEVIPDDEASRQRNDVLGYMAANYNMRPLGLFGPGDKRQPYGGPVSNVRVQHPPDRSFDASTPKITFTYKHDVKNLDSGEDDGADPLKMVGDDLESRLEQRFGESLLRPEDGYDLMQRIVDELGMVASARKFKSSDGSSVVEACDGIVCITFKYPGILCVYKGGSKKGELEVDIGVGSVLDDSLEWIRSLI